MNVTYIIGNGFDICCGLKTKYEDFYDYLKNNYDSNDCENLIIKEIINRDDINYWSDLEMSLGEYTKDIIDNDQLEKFYEDKYNLENELSKYLNKEQKRIDWNKNCVKDEMKRKFLTDILKPYKYFTPVIKEKLKKIFEGENSYNIITLNYTNVLANCCKISGLNINPKYAHGSLESNHIILGVDNTNQISSNKFRDSIYMSINMCKPNIDNEIGGNGIKNCRSILQYSDVICLFGVSLGCTDLSWWEMINSLLINRRVQKILIFAYDSKLDMNFLYKVAQAKDKIKNNLLKYSLKDENEKANISLRNSIEVIFNSDMLNIKLPMTSNENQLESDSEKLISQV